MKKVVLLTAIALLSISTFAQDRFALGLKAGFNSTKINLSDIPDGTTIKNEANNGYLIGAYGKLRLLGSLSFQPEIYYTKKSSEISISDEFSPVINNESVFHTWDIPLLANLQVLDLKAFKVYGIAGPVASFIAKTETDIPELDEFKNTNWTFQAGGGIEFWRLTADVRYEWGLSDISDLADFNLGQKTDVLTFSVGFKLFGM
ncbi:porin family protein [Carboxylicivirga sp. RSCT41]|uniref:porin family protein n=1 Tax=Carboxylicivirga agarovorans TaxID=3417570 RepID=UPI003D32B7C2